MQLLIKKNGEKVKVVIKIYLLILLASPPKKHAYGKSMHAPTHWAEHHDDIHAFVHLLILCLSLATWGHDGLCEAWPSHGGDGVAEDVVLASLDGQGIGQPQQAQLGGTVVGLTEVTVDTRCRGRHDDSGRRQEKGGEAKMTSTDT